LEVSNISLIGILMCWMCSASGGISAVVYDESGLQGDFSDDYLNPTPVTFGYGENLIKGSVRGNPVDRDLFTVSIPAGMSLAAIRVIEFAGALDALSFMGAQPGSVLSDSPLMYILAGQDPTVSVGPINYVLFGGADAAVDRDVMPQLVVGAPMSGQNPLPAGQYAFWINETRALTSYTLDFEVVPEPGAAGMILAALACGLARRFRR
jgi:hypothetical protein